MKDTKKFLILLIFSLFCIAVSFTAGCSSPIGGILDSIDYIKAVPSKAAYGQDEWFRPAEDLKVIGVFGGVEEDIDIDKVTIKIVQEPGYSGEKEYPVTNNQQGLKLVYTGLKTVVISYDNLEASYAIIVGEPGTGNPGWGNSPGGTGIGIDWPIDR
jgi:hypothetical protein